MGMKLVVRTGKLLGLGLVSMVGLCATFTPARADALVSALQPSPEAYPGSIQVETTFAPSSNRPAPPNEIRSDMALLTLGIIFVVPAGTSSTTGGSSNSVVQAPGGGNGNGQNLGSGQIAGGEDPGPQTAPEPASLVTAFFGSTLAAIACLRRRRSRHQPTSDWLT